jgi:solute carrier family 6 GABA transporter-like protein 1
MITGFIIAHIGLAIVILGFVMPRYYDIFVPLHRRDEGTEPTIANKPKGTIVARAIEDEIQGTREDDDGLADGGESGRQPKPSEKP